MKRIITCCVCGAEEFAEGTCPNEIMSSSGYLQDDDDWENWYCSEKCKNSFKNLKFSVCEIKD